MLHSTASLLSFLICYTSAYLISIDNPTFEDDGPLPDNTYEYKNVLSTWDIYDPSKIMDGSHGIQNPTGGTAYSDDQFGADAPQGANALWLEQEDNKEFGEGEIGVEQTLTETVSADTRYKLTVYVGNTASNDWTDGTEGGGQTDCAGFPGYRVQLLAGNAILAEDNDELTIAEGGWELSTVAVTVLSGDNNIGKSLGIRLINKNGAQGGLEVAFDDVELEALSITQSTTTKSPTNPPTKRPTAQPTLAPSAGPSLAPIIAPTISPNNEPTISPIIEPTISPNNDPTALPTEVPSASPTKRPVFEPTSDPIQTPAPVVNIASTVDEGDGDDDGANDVKEESGSANGLLQDYMPSIIGVAGIVSGCFCFCLCFVLFKTKRKKDAQNVGDKSPRAQSDEPLRVRDGAQIVGRRMQKVPSVEMPSNKEQKLNKIVPQNDADEKEVALFFSKELQLPQYYQLFIDNGYDSMRAMMAIKDKSELEEIGVNVIGHQSFILSIIKKKKEETDGQMTTDAMTTTEAQHAEKDNYEQEEINAQMKRDRQMVKAWFDFNVGLAKYKYHELFIKNGYESMKAMQAIRSKTELEEIGVTILGHRALIFSEIERLRNMELNAQYGGVYNAHQMQQYGGQGMQQQYGMQINYEGGGGNGPGGEW